MLSHAIGSDGVERLPADLQHLPLEDGDRLLLCSDGLSDPLTDGQIAQILTAAKSPREACADLIAGALDGGGPDNVTCVVADVSLQRIGG